MGPSTLTSWALLIHRALSAHGIDGDAMFRRAVLDPAQMRDPNARYPMAAMQRLWSLATAATNECFGLDVAKEWHPTTFHALGYSALASETLREALSRSARYSRVVTTGARLELHDLGSEVMVSARSSIPEEKVVPASLDAGLASLLIMCREGSGRQVDPARVELVRATVGCRERLADFFNCPIKLGAPTNALVFRASDLDARLPTANAVLLRVNEQAATDYMAHLDRNEIIVQVQAKLFQLLPTGELSEMQMARALNLSLRSMQRKLKEKGVTFRGLLDASRRQLAEQYLKDSTLSVSEIAYLLGFAEVSSFSRAFKRWTGRAPRAQAHVA